MNLLEIVQRLHHEAKLAGSPPPAVSGLTGRAADLVRWTIEAWNDIQREKDGRWKWLRRGFVVETSNGDPRYSYGDCDDEDEGVEIDRFRAWDIDPDDLPFIYLVSDGEASERELAIAEWRHFRRTYVRGTHTPSYPGCIAVDPSDDLWLGPTPDGVYRLSGNYWRGNQVLSLADDVPEMPVDYHMLIVYRALVKYAYKIVGHEILAEARAEGTPMYEALVMNQWYGRMRISTAGALA